MDDGTAPAGGAVANWWNSPSRVAAGGAVWMMEQPQPEELYG